MSSIADGHFPQFVWRGDKRLLWNPIYRRTLVNRPEERVRLRILEYLLASGWSRNRISTEEKIAVENRHSPLRTDIICYSSSFKPEILVECKAEQVTINQNAAEQSARYNHAVGAPYILLTNGRRDYWFEIDGDDVIPRNNPPAELNTEDAPNKRPLHYWRSRGFAGKNLEPDLDTWLSAVLNSFWNIPELEIRYLEFSRTPTEISLSHYYGITTFGKDKIAISFISTPKGDTRIVAILNRNGSNSGIILIDPQMLNRSPEKSGVVLLQNRKKEFDALEACMLNPARVPDSSIEEMPSRLLDQFNLYLENSP